ncbi:5'-nucleotidase C-terminal domain-containing protein [Flavobacterium sp. TSSA_36]|uniref:5'-nucleotidase C-terminal domain-containing protein n=1 Tax=Flavobacterium sp. TSSA_36 TaxID=3447669 RepID=UPI003F2EFA8F
MVKLKKYIQIFKLFVIFLTFSSIFSCAPKAYQLTKIEGKRVSVNNTLTSTEKIDVYLKPYRDNIDKDLNTVLAYSPETLDKSSGKWQTTIGNLMADACLERGNVILKARENKQIDICLLNHGGIRSILPKGEVTTRTAFQIMPFENSLVVITLKGETVMELITYFIKTKKPQPLSGLTFTIDKNDQPKDIKIKGVAFDISKEYQVATNDYLASGGDDMSFFKKGIKTYDLDYKLRNVLIDYFKEIKTIPVLKEARITEE